VSVILKVWSNNPFNNGGCDFAIVELTQDLANLALLRISRLCDQKSLDPSVYETYYWGSEAEYFNGWLEQPSASEETKASCMDLEERLEKLQVDAREMVLTTEEFAVCEKQIALVECGQMIVRENGVAFTAIPKHTDFYVTTAEIPKEVLQQAVTSAKN
jgi:hypothetical protein